MLTIEEYLQVLPNYTFPERIILRAMETYDIEEHTPFRDVPEKERDLAEAIIWDAASGIVNGGAERKQIGNRSISSASIQVSQKDREAWAAKAKYLRAKWGVDAVTVEILQISDLTQLW